MTKTEQLDQVYKEREKLFEDTLKMLDETKLALHAREKELAEKEAALDATENELAEKKAALDDTENELAEKKAALDVTENELTEKKAELDAKEKEFAEKKANPLAQEQEDKINELQKEVEALQDKNEEYLLTLESLRNEKLKARLSGHYNSDQSAKIAAKESSQDHEREMNRLHQTIDELEERVKELIQSNKELDGDNKDLSQTNKNLISEVSRLTKADDDQKREIDRLIQSKKELEEQNTSLTKQLLETQKDNGVKSYYDSNNNRRVFDQKLTADALSNYLTGKGITSYISHNKEGEIVSFPKGDDTIYVCFEGRKILTNIFRPCQDIAEVRTFIEECNASQDKIRFEYDKKRAGLLLRAEVFGNITSQKLYEDIMAVWQMYFQSFDQL